MRYVASREEMQQIDAYSINTMGIPGIVLMEKAALALEWSGAWASFIRRWIQC